MFLRLDSAVVRELFCLQPVDQDSPDDEVQRHELSQFQVLEATDEQQQLASHHNREALRRVPVPHVRAVERSLAGNDVELEEVERNEHPVSVEDAIDE